MMGEFLEYFKQKKNLANLLLVGIVVLALPLVVQVARQQQIIKSRASNAPIVFSGDNMIDQTKFKLDSAGKATIGLELTSPIESSVQTADSGKILMSLVPKELVKTVYACEMNPDGSGSIVRACEENCPNGGVRHGNIYCVWNAEGNTESDCSFYDSCPAAPPAGNPPGGTGTGIDSAADVGGCCDPGAANNTARGCRRDSNPGGFREVCDINNRECASGFSCRSETGCALDSDCGLPNNHCESGVCKPGVPNTNCKVASSLEARFNGAATLTVAAGTKVIAGINRNGTGVPVGAPVNDVAVVDVLTASISGPTGFSKVTLDPAISNNFTPTIGGQYTLTGTCGSNLTDTAKLTVTGGTASPSPSGSVAPGACPGGVNACGGGNYEGLGTCNGTGGPRGNGWVWQDSTHHVDGNFDATDEWCRVNAGGTRNACYTCLAANITSPTPTPTPSVPPVTTVSFRVAESPADFSETGKYGWQTYTSPSVTTTFEFKDINPGLKNIFVEFKYSNGTKERKTKQIRLVGPDPVITSCSLSFEANNTTVLNLVGTNFGTTKGTVKSGDTPLSTIKEWKDKSIKVAYPNAPEGERLPVIMTSSDGQSSQEDGTCSAVAQLSLGAKVFCRTASAQDTANVDLTLVGDFPGGKKVKQKVSIDKEGNIAGLSQKLQDGQNYKLSLKAPKSVRKTVKFTAGVGSTNIPNFVLPVGDIVPVPVGDGTINTLDKSELNRQWIIASSASGRTGDFNGDSRVNSIDWACMRFDFGSSDDSEPSVPAGTPIPTTAPTASASATVAPSPSVSPSPSPSASPVGNNNPVGFLDGVDNSTCKAGGWTCDADDNNASLDVHFYIDNPAGPGAFASGSVKADQARADLVSAGVCGRTANHGFAFSLPDIVKDGNSHTVYAYGININGGNNILLAGSPKQFNCTLAP